MNKAILVGLIVFALVAMSAVTVLAGPLIPTDEGEATGPIRVTSACVSSGAITTYNGNVFRNGQPIWVKTYQTEQAWEARLSPNGRQLLITLLSYTGDGIRTYTVSYPIDRCSKLGAPIVSKSEMIRAWTKK